MNNEESSKNQKNDEHFYDDLDQKRSHSSCCTCQTLVLLFFFLLIILGVGCWYTYRRITTVNFLPGSLTSNFSVEDLTKNLTSQKPDENGDIQIVLSEDDLSALMAGGLSFQSFILKDVQTSINPNEIIFYASLVKPLSSKLVIGLVPSVASGKIIFETSSITAGSLKLPKIMVDQIGKAFNSSVDSRLEPIYAHMTVETVTLGDQQLIITGKAK